MFYFEAFVNVV